MDLLIFFSVPHSVKYIVLYASSQESCEIDRERYYCSHYMDKEGKDGSEKRSELPKATQLANGLLGVRLRIIGHAVPRLSIGSPSKRGVCAFLIYIKKEICCVCDL